LLLEGRDALQDVVLFAYLALQLYRPKAGVDDLVCYCGGTGLERVLALGPEHPLGELLEQRLDLDQFVEGPRTLPPRRAMRWRRSALVGSWAQQRPCWPSADLWQRSPFGFIALHSAIN
jgi:hypothetical protein